MSRLLLISFAVTVCIISGIEAEPIKVPVSTRYITTAITTIGQGVEKTFIAALCQQFSGETINATLLLNNNPSWDVPSGVVYYYIVDDPAKTQKDALCNNTDKAGVPGPYCIIQKWSSTKDMYLKARAGDVSGISFSIDIDIQKNAKKGIVKDHKTYAAPGFTNSSTSRLHLKVDTEYLTEIVTVETSQRLAYKKEALLEITFCPNPFTTLDYKINSIIYGTDGISSYAQYICEKLPCQVDNPDVVGSNGKQVPNNIVTLTTQSGQYSHIYVLVVCWSGQYYPTPSPGNFYGEFQYSGSLMRESP
ncbi:uncharacterized protein [Amphiura filiformis]|uniref:uncharacterized protein n=1 Tax=Amphiura filiformis TaxID=82378 RepID=UPI003B20B7C2